MTTADLVARLRALGVFLVLEGDRVIADGPEDVLTAAAVAELRLRKPAVVAFLRAERGGVVLHGHRCPGCGAHLRCTAPGCATRVAYPCVVCRLDRVGDTGAGNGGARD